MATEQFITFYFSGSRRLHHGYFFPLATETNHSTPNAAGGKFLVLLLTEKQRTAKDFWR